jgi:epsilon-lactone hydrolase
VTVDDDRPVLHVPARDIPVPSFLSAEAQAVLGLGVMGASAYPAVDDREGWRELVRARDEMVLAIISERLRPEDVAVEELDIDGVAIFAIAPGGTTTDDARVVLELHGGALVMGGGAVCRAMGIGAAQRLGAPTWAVDYRMAPDHPYPAPLDDCLAAYRALLRDHHPDEIIVSGTSAGGNLSAAVILRARDEGLPLPAGAVLLTPELDLTESGDSFRTNLGLDTVLTESLMPANLLYAGGHDLADPYLSPLFGDFSRGFPPTLLTAGTRDLFLSNAVRMHRALRAAEVPAELHVLEAAPHGGFFGRAREDAAVNREVRRFADERWSVRA